MTSKSLVNRVRKLEIDMYGNGSSGCKSIVKSLRSSFNILKFMFCAMLSLQIVMISILLVYISLYK